MCVCYICTSVCLHKYSIAINIYSIVCMRLQIHVYTVYLFLYLYLPTFVCCTQLKYIAKEKFSDAELQSINQRDNQDDLPWHGSCPCAWVVSLNISTLLLQCVQRYSLPFNFKCRFVWDKNNGLLGRSQVMIHFWRVSLTDCIMLHVFLCHRVALLKCWIVHDVLQQLVGFPMNDERFGNVGGTSCSWLFVLFPIVLLLLDNLMGDIQPQGITIGNNRKQQETIKNITRG